MKKIAIKGSLNPNEQIEIIEILESLGGKNKHNFVGDLYWAYYYINNYNIIDTTCDIDNLKGYVLVTLEQYKEKYMNKENNKELQIIAPEGYEIDKEQSSFEKIVFKKIEKKLTYKDIANKLFGSNKFYYTDDYGDIKNVKTIFWSTHPNNAPTSQQLERLLAINKLMNTAHYLNDGWKPDWESYIEYKYFIHYENKIFKIGANTLANYGIIYFKSKELAEQAIEILGEETIKLALGVCLKNILNL